MDDQKHQETVERIRKKSCKAQRNRYEEQVWKPRFHNSLTHPEKTLDNEALQAKSHPSHNGRGQVKAQPK